MFRVFKRSVSSLGTNKTLIKYSLLSNTAFGLFLRGAGDIIQQTIERKNDTEKQKQSKFYDWTRTVHTSAPGIILTPLNYYWLVYLDKILPARTFKVIGKKILLDQAIGAPVFLFIFIVMVCLIEGKTVSESLKEFYQKFLFIYLVDWVVWPPAQAINFYLIPSHLRMAFVNLVIVGWNVFLSYAKNNEI